MRLWSRQWFRFKLPESPGFRLTDRGRRAWVSAWFLLFCGCVTAALPLIHLALGVLVLLAVSVPLARLNVSGLRYGRKTCDSTRVGEWFDVEVEIVNSRRVWPAFGLRLTDSLLEAGRGGCLEFGRVSCGGSVRVTAWTRLARRGLHGGFGARVESSFPFGLASCEALFEPVGTLVVQPRPARTASLERLLAVGAGEGFARRGVASEAMGEFRTLRDFVAGDSPRMVCWSASVRHSRLVVREFESPVPRHVHIVFHSCSIPMVMLSARSFERSLEALAGLFRDLHERSVSFSFSADFVGWCCLVVAPGVAALDPALDRLAEAVMSVDSPPAAAYAAVCAAPEEADAILVLSNTPVRYWAAGLPSVSAQVLCFDNSLLIVDPESDPAGEEQPA